MGQWAGQHSAERHLPIGRSAIRIMAEGRFKVSDLTSPRKGLVMNAFIVDIEEDDV